MCGDQLSRRDSSNVLLKMPAYFLMPMIMMVTIIIITQNKKNQQRRQMGPRLKIDPEQFQKLILESGSKIIKGPKVWGQGYTYLIRMKDYYYYTISKEELDISDEYEILEVKHILL